MATKLQRAQAICNALVNGTATPAQMTRLADAFAGLSINGGNLTNAQKVDLLVRKVREFCIDAMRRHEGESAAAQARNESGAAVDAGFAEAP